MDRKPSAGNRFRTPFYLAASLRGRRTSENVENLILKHLRALRNELRDLKVEVTVDLALIKQRLTSFESQVPDLQLLHRVAGGISAEIVGPRSGTIKTTTRYLLFRMTLAD